MPDEVYLRSIDIYAVKRNTPLHLAVAIGLGQIGSVVLDWDGQMIEPDDIENIPVGRAGEDLRGRILGVIVKVKDVNESTNRTNVSCVFTGGRRAKTFDYSLTVTGAGGYAHYNLDFLFISGGRRP
ncbi:MAG: hypothetical protein RBT60_08885 [Candidatus Krumholzibacteria bacterium]|jgi:hypothetical protein|nr:hypothetical protein [Candidatus Krumholzibacteria bacterium]